jgi:AcrR family transcriptional regulator
MTERAPRRPGRPAGGKPVVDREHVLDAAERAIRREGAAVSIETIAREAGVTKPIVYAHVGGRAELGNTLAQRLSDHLVAASGRALKGHSSGREALAALLKSNLETINENRELFHYVMSGTSHDNLSIAQRSTSPLAEVIGAWRKDQGLDPAVATPWAYAIVGMLNFVALWWISESERPADEVAEQLVELLWSGLSEPQRKRRARAR